MEIIPAILPQNFNEIDEKTSLLVGLADVVQIDICDGKFVPSVTWPYKKRDENFEAILHEERGMPSWEELDYEFDLMIKDPSEDDARQWLSAGASRVVLHAESSADLHPAMKILNGLVEIGLALNIQTPLEVIEKYKAYITYIQFMGITKIGFQGQAFDERVLEKIKEAKEKYPDLAIQVDGGVSLATAEWLGEAGADRLVAGSVLFNSDNIVDTYRKLKMI
jgi:ribulose-phosphate 3-epimerase